MSLIGVTQRITRINERGELRDSLAQDWGRFFRRLETPWVALPNHPLDAVTLAQKLGITALVFTGGDDVGLYPERDATELALFRWAEQNCLPCLGICRGFQMMQLWLGGELEQINPAVHRATRHDVLFSNGEKRKVNSFHNSGIVTPARDFEVLAVCKEDQTIEAACLKPGILGIMWHPERETVLHAQDLQMITSHCNIQSACKQI